MAQANSLQREPSMEEILASIRRIIEDSDTVRKNEDEGMAAVAPVQAGTPNDIRAFREEFGTSPALQAAAKPASLAEIQAEVARERQESSGSEKLREQPSVVARQAEPEADAYDDDADDGDPLNFPPFEAVRAENQNPRPAIISEQAGRQVAAAFEELSEVFAASRRKSFDEMAEEMLRPMLQDWLDNNLPLLVERLVREEIERVARGDAR